MDDNVKEILLLAITTLGTVLIAWIKMRSDHHEPGKPPAPPAPSSPPGPGGGAGGDSSST